MLVFDLSNRHTKLEGYELRLRKQEWCPNEQGISRMIYKKFIKEMGGPKYEYNLLTRLIDVNENIYELLQKLQRHFTADERYLLIKSSLKGLDKERTFLSLLQNI